MSQGYIDPDYVGVPERLQLFFDRYPDGRLTTDPPWVMEIGGRPFVCCRVHIYRTPDDEHPSTGVAWEPVPGPTPFTRDSELMNAQTSAWGRAIVAAGIPSKKIASAEDVQARTDNGPPDDRDLQAQLRTKEQNRMLHHVLGKLDENQPRTDQRPWKEYAREWTVQNFDKHSTAQLTKGEMGQLIEHLDDLAAPF